MKLYIMKRDALETLKANLPAVFGKYYTEKTNRWIGDVCGQNPFIEFKDVEEFELYDLDSDLSPGEIDLNNCKILYEKLQFLSESQACDERLWAGLSHSTFYGYMRKRWRYGYGKKPKEAKKESGEILTRFFYKSYGRNGFYRNSLSKCWWVGRNTYNQNNTINHFENLDIIGSNDLSSKITELFFNFNFSSNTYILNAVIDALRQFNEEGRRLSVRDHIRPAMSYLNAVGGSVVLDCLEQEEITRILVDAIDAIMQGDTPALILDNNMGDVEEGIEDYEDDNNDKSGDLGMHEVILGCKVIVRNSNKKTKTYKYDLIDGVMPKTVEIFTGHKIGDYVEINGEQWKIEDVII